MDTLKQKIEELLKIAGFDYSVSVDDSANKVSIFVHDKEVSEKNLPKFLADFEHVVRTMAKKLGLEKVSVDVNNYKKERETLIAELAKAAARKAAESAREAANRAFMVASLLGRTCCNAVAADSWALGFSRASA